MTDEAATDEAATELHHQAMAFAEMADGARKNGLLVEHRCWLIAAFRLERRAAKLVRHQPSRRILFESARELVREIMTKNGE
jgi:hypothetical protein